MLTQASIRSVNADTAVITLSGPLTLGTSLKTADMQIHNAIDRGVHRLVLEMSGVPYIDSAGLGALVHAFGMAKERGGSLRLCGVSERIVSLLRTTQVDSILPISADEQTALAALEVCMPAREG